MRRFLLALLLCMVVSAAGLQAQRAGGGGAQGGFHGGFGHAGVSGKGTTIGITGGNGFGRGFNRRRGFNYGYGGWPGYYGGYGYGLDWDLPYWDYADFPLSDGPSDSPARHADDQRPVVVMRNSTPAAPVESPKLIEIPLSNAAVVKPQPPALFVLASGEKLESRRYVISANSLQVDVGRTQRTIPISDLNVDATIAANQQRGLDVSFPQDRNSLFLGF